MGVWVMAGSWCSDNLMDGFVPRSVLSRWGTAQDAAALVDAELWEVAERDGEKGWLFRNWAEYQPSRAEVESEREASKERVRKWREAKRGKGSNAVGNAVTNTVTNTVSNADVTGGVRSPRPDPTRPTKKNPSSADADAIFEAWWKLYPRKVGKQDARRVWDRKIRDTDPATITDGLRRYLPLYAQTEPDFVPHPSTWLQQGRWEDEVSAPDPDEDLPHYWRTGP